jgi:hypothetical protein
LASRITGNASRSSKRKEPPLEEAGGRKKPASRRTQGGKLKEGQVYLENQPIPLEQLQAVLAKVSDVPVLIKADGMTTLEVMTDVMDACRLNGLSKIRIQSR